MLNFHPHLTFNGQCEAAFTLYAKCLGGEIGLMMRYGDSPLAEETPPEMHKHILHATLAVGEHRLTGGDAPPGLYQKPQGFAVLLNIDDAADAERIFKTLAENGTVQMPLEPTFWAERFGMLADQFGTPWMINCGRSS
jgi:PhnB protein